MKQAHIVHVIVTHLTQTMEAPEKKTGERNSRKRSSYKGQRVKINMARQRAESSPFPKVNLLYKMKENPTVTEAKTAEEQPISENRSSVNGNKNSVSTKVDHSDNNIDRPCRT